MSFFAVRFSFFRSVTDCRAFSLPLSLLLVFADRKRQLLQIRLYLHLIMMRMMMSLLRFTFVLLVATALWIPKVSSLVSPSRPTTFRRWTWRFSATTNNDHDDNDVDETSLASVYSLSSTMNEPYSYFEVHQIPTATAGLAGSASRLDHVVDCAENGECSVQEMSDMIDGTYKVCQSTDLFRS
jgi:hypothetical protein